MEENNKRFLDLISECEKEQHALDKKYSLISTFRVISFLAGVALGIIFVKDKLMIAGVAGGVFLLLFIVLIVIHKNVDIRKKKADSRFSVLTRYKSRFNEDWRNFEENGYQYLKGADTVSRDLDLLGQNSLYQMINVCHTDHGKQMLAEAFAMNKAPEKEVIEKRQAAVRELIDKWEFAINFEAAGERLSNKKKSFSSEAFEKFCKDEKKGFLPAWAKVISIVLPIIEISLIVAWAIGVIHYGYAIAGFIVLLGFTWLTNSVIEGASFSVFNMSFVFDNYLDMLQEIEKQDFESELLCEMKSKLCGDSGAMKAFAELRKLAQAYNISFNPVVHQVLSGIILWDYQLAKIAGGWKRKYADKVAGSFATIGELEMLLSLSALGRVRNVCWADINTDKTEVYANCENIYHPLIDAKKVIANSCDFNSGITIITGSNMSGKTTFLRTLAMNLTLAYIGGPVCGDSMSASYMKIFTSMRVTDDVAHGISTFYAEILRIKEMSLYKDNKLPMICLVDEIFKGTNSADRIVGAREVITGLADKYCMAIVSTHDFELCTIKDKNGAEASNYHFEEYYEDDELKFDYKIKDGRCTTTNARAILRMAGFDVV